MGCSLPAEFVNAGAQALGNSGSEMSCTPGPRMRRSISDAIPAFQASVVAAGSGAEYTGPRIQLPDTTTRIRHDPDASIPGRGADAVRAELRDAPLYARLDHSELAPSGESGAGPGRLGERPSGGGIWSGRRHV